MRICLLGGFYRNSDEGMKKVSNTINRRLSFKHDIIYLNPKELFKKKNIDNIRMFQPEIIHYLHGPTIRSLILLKAVKLITNTSAKLICSATRPFFSKFSKWAVYLFRPDLVLTQSVTFEDFFKRRGCDVHFLPNGVDCQEFCPVIDSEKILIKQNLGLSLDKKIVLHVGQFKANRNLEIFKEIQMVENLQVVIVGGTTETADETLKNDLQRAGIKIFHEYFDDIAAFYKMADLYIFPLKDTGDKLPDSYDQMGAIDIPLSVLEAMACNLPVLTTKFGALPRILENSNGLTFCRTDDDILNAVKRSFNGVSINTRQKVIPYNWDRVIDQLEKIYKGIIISEPVAAIF